MLFPCELRPLSAGKKRGGSVAGLAWLGMMALQQQTSHNAILLSATTRATITSEKQPARVQLNSVPQSSREHLVALWLIIKRKHHHHHLPHRSEFESNRQSAQLWSHTTRSSAEKIAFEISSNSSRSNEPPGRRKKLVNSRTNWTECGAS